MPWLRDKLKLKREAVPVGMDSFAQEVVLPTLCSVALILLDFVRVCYFFRSGLIAGGGE